MAAVASVPYIPASVDYLETEFGGHGVAFEGLGDSYVVKMGLENGSLASLMLPSGLITSYKAPMWHGGTLELLHTTVTEEQSGALIQGGVSLALDCESDGGISWSPSSWILQDVRGNAEELIQVSSQFFDVIIANLKDGEKIFDWGSLETQENLCTFSKLVYKSFKF